MNAITCKASETRMPSQSAAARSALIKLEKIEENEKKKMQ